MAHRRAIRHAYVSASLRNLTTTGELDPWRSGANARCQPDHAAAVALLAAANPGASNGRTEPSTIRGIVLGHPPFYGMGCNRIGMVLTKPPKLTIGNPGATSHG